MSPTTITPDAVLESAPPLNERGLVDLVCPKSGARILLTADENAYLPNGGFRRVRAGREVRFHNSRASITLEDFELLREHPAYTGEGEPKIVFLAHERGIVQGSSGPQVVDGPQSSMSGERMPPPVPAWDKMTHKAIRASIKQGLVTSPVDALVYERSHRNRPGVILVLAAAVSGPAEKLPTATQMAAEDRRQHGDRPAPPEEEAEEDAEEVLAAEAAMLPTDQDIREQIAAAIAEAELEGDLDSGEDEPAPSEGVE